MDSIISKQNTIHFMSTAYEMLNILIKEENYSKIFIITDTNTHEYCYPSFVPEIKTKTLIEIIQIDAGEEFKNIETCVGIWNVLSELEADKRSLIINLGGGVVTDLGGFVASTYKRGIDFINVPTSLLAMVDASVGGKTGVDLGVLKNHIGVINKAKMVVIDPKFLKSLPIDEFRSGLAEILKHGLIQDKNYWLEVIDFKNLETSKLDSVIYKSIEIKNQIVSLDPYENNIRKSLNYGHTIGHAIESYFLENPSKEKLLHGEAIAIGIVLACYLSSKTVNFPISECNQIKAIIQKLYGKVHFSKEDIETIISYLKYDKKNSHGIIKFVLLEQIGKPIIDCTIPNLLIKEAFDYYKS